MVSKLACRFPSRYIYIIYIYIFFFSFLVGSGQSIFLVEVGLLSLLYKARSTVLNSMIFQKQTTGRYLLDFSPTVSVWEFLS